MDYCYEGTFLLEGVCMPKNGVALKKILLRFFF